MKQNYLSKNVPLIGGTNVPLVKIDNKWRIQLTKETRKILDLKRNDHLLVRPESKGKVVLERVREDVAKDDPIFKFLNNPVKIRSQKIKAEIKRLGWKKFMEKLDEEWYG